MKSARRTTFLQIQNLIYQCVQPFIFQRDAQAAHESAMLLLSYLDSKKLGQLAAQSIYRLSFPDTPLCAGNVTLPHPLILAAGFVKGHGFDGEQSALKAVEQGINIMPGWRTMPNLVGLVEFGSFTRWPRSGNPSTVIWRDKSTYSTQNRVGLKNPGVKAAAEFLSRQRTLLPKTYGLNIAVTPGLNDVEHEAEEIRESLDAFLSKDVIPEWFTLNLSCPNTEDDPGNHQTQKKTYDLCKAALGHLENSTQKAPLWVKISPALSKEQYHVLADVFNNLKIPAVLATNTLPQPSPDSDSLIAGVGGGRLHTYAVDAALQIKKAGYRGDLIGCGGIIDPMTYMDYRKQGIQAMQYWSALVYRGPLVAAHILNEVISDEL